MAEKIYLTVSLAKYPFLKDYGVGSKGTANFKAEVIEQGNKENYGTLVDGDKDNKKDEEIFHDITFHDIFPKEKKVRV